MGQHDSLDGFVTYLQLQTTEAKLVTGLGGPSLKQEVAGLALMLEGGTWATADPLGIGGLLMDACRLEQLIRQEMLPNAELLCRVLAAALEGLRHYGRNDDLRLPASRRLGLRELGLAIGLHAIEKLPQPSRGSNLRALLDALKPYASLGSTIESFWLGPEHRKARTWSEHGDINEVMLATSLIPEGCLVLHSMN